MKRAFSVTWFALRATYDELFLLAGMGLIWFLFTLAIPYGVFYLTSTYVPIVGVIIAAVLLSLIPVPPITGALYAVTTKIAREKRIEFADFWTGFKENFWLSWKLGAIVLVSGAILAVDISFYFRQENVVYTAIAFLGMWALLLWLAVQIYLFPLMLIQEDRRVRLIVKNGGLLALAYPLYALIILVVTVLVTALSVFLVILLPTLWMPFVAVLYSRATVSSLEEVQAYRQRQEDLEAEAESEEE
jgi:uncharacterized membrane protein YesL